jgi:hypothetical protein
MLQQAGHEMLVAVMNKTVKVPNLDYSGGSVLAPAVD